MTSDLVPALPPGACQVWWAEVTPDQRQLASLLDEPERNRAAQLRHEGARALYVLAHGMTRVVLGRLLDVAPRDLAFTASCRRCGGPHGRPELASPRVPLRLSISHSGDRAAVAFTRDVEVGIDVEQVSPRGATLPSIALSAAERATLDQTPAGERTTAFLRYWTRKEAVLKATGHGLGVAPARLTVSAPHEPPALLAWAGGEALPAPVFLVDLTAPPGYLASLATLERPVGVSEHHFATPAACID